MVELVYYSHNKTIRKKYLARLGLSVEKQEWNGLLSVCPS
jgi:hypothetical protein